MVLLPFNEHTHGHGKTRTSLRSREARFSVPGPLPRPEVRLYPRERTELTELMLAARSVLTVNS